MGDGSWEMGVRRWEFGDGSWLAKIENNTSNQQRRQLKVVDIKSAVRLTSQNSKPVVR
jgi:hypothetical protein